MISFGLGLHWLVAFQCLHLTIKKKKRFQPVFARYFFFVFIVLSSGILSVRNADLESTDRPKMVGFFFVTCSFSARRCSFLGCLLGARMSTWYLIRATQDSAIYHRPHVFSHFSPLSREGESRSGITRSEVSVLKLLLRVLREAWPEPALFLCSPRPPCSLTSRRGNGSMWR